MINLLEYRPHYSDNKLVKNHLHCSTVIKEQWPHFLRQKSLHSSRCKLLALYPRGPVDQPQI